MSARANDFGIVVEFVLDEIVVAVRGDLDLQTAPNLSSVLAALANSNPRRIVLNLATPGFIDSSGLQAIADESARSTPLGGTLIVRTTSAFTRQLFELTGLEQLLESEQNTRSSMESTPPGSARDRKRGTSRRLTALPYDHDAVDGALRLVVNLARASVGGADGVSVSLRRHGRLSTVASSDQTILAMDAEQYATMEGPCVDASAEGRSFLTESLNKESRWPSFTPRARALGIHSILSSPLLAHDQPVGALNIYARSANAFRPSDQALAATFATEASTILTAAGADLTDEEVTTRMQLALRIRQIIAQAQGVLMQQHRISEEDAYTCLRRASQTSNRPLREEAGEIVAATRPIRDSDHRPRRHG